MDGVQVADNEIARDFGNDDPGLAVFRNQLLLLNDGRRLVLHDLRAQVGRVDHAMSRVRVCTVDRVAVEHVRCTRFKLGFHDALHNVDGLYRNAAPAGSPRLQHTFDGIRLRLVLDHRSLPDPADGHSRLSSP